MPHISSEDFLVIRSLISGATGFDGPICIVNARTWAQNSGILTTTLDYTLEELLKVRGHFPSGGRGRRRPSKATEAGIAYHLQSALAVLDGIERAWRGQEWAWSYLIDPEGDDEPPDRSPVNASNEEGGVA